MCRSGAFVETVEIDVIELQTSGIRIYERKRRARDVFFSDTQRGADAFDEESFARA